MVTDKPDLQAIIRFFEWSDKRVWSRLELEDVVAQHRQHWSLPSLSTGRVTSLLLQSTPLTEVRLTTLRPPAIRYCWTEASAYEVAVSLHPTGYLAYESAMHLHGLTD